MVKMKAPKVHTLMTALESLRKYCVYQERSQHEVRSKFYSLGMDTKEAEQGIAILIEEGFINEERFAIAYAGGKFRIKKWGKVKIKAGLKARKISDYCISKALSQIDDKEYLNTLKLTIDSKMRRSAYRNSLSNNYKVAQYAISHGFEPDLVWDVIRKYTG